MRFVYLGSRFTLHASSPRSVALTQLRFTRLAVASSAGDLHPEDRAHAGRTNMRFIAGSSDGLSPEVFRGHAQYRYKVFVEKLGCKLKARDGLEFDEFDRPDTLYVVAQDDDGAVIGTAHLLPTTRPYLLAELRKRRWCGTTRCSNRHPRCGTKRSRMASGSAGRNRRATPTASPAC
jgi:hypothetical protein